MTCSFVTPKRGNKLAFHSDKYRANPVWNDPDMQSKSNYQKNLKIWEWKVNVQIKADNFFSMFAVRNLRLSHTLVLSGHMIRKVDAGSSLGDDMFRKGRMGKEEMKKFWHPLCWSA